MVLLFYPLGLMFVCPIELCSFSDRIDEFQALDCEVHFNDVSEGVKCSVVRIMNAIFRTPHPDAFDI